ncbi:MAG TPA: hypothetical protein ENJ08_08080 [Gammaproteobacteria bacterium]|nr:hypothetical protein [Gammaproteobacteria bacterium]
MTTGYSKKRSFNARHIKNLLLGAVGLLIILLAISFTLLRVAIKSVPDYTQTIQELASEKAGMKIEVGSLDAEMHWLVPRLNLLDVKISDETGTKHFLKADDLTLSLDWVGTITTLTPVVGEIILSGVDIKIGINKQSQLLVQNYVIHDDVSRQLQAVGKASGLQGTVFEVSEEIKYIVNNLNVKILDSSFEFYDERDSHRNKKLRNFSLRLFHDVDEHAFEVKADLPEKYGKDIHLIFDVDGDLFDYKNLHGDAYLSINNIHAAPWLDDYWDYLQFSASGVVDAQIWLSWEAKQITEIQSQLGLADITLSYLDETVNSWKLDKLDAGVQWVKNDTGWKLDIRDLTSARNGVVRSEPSSATIEMLDSSRELNLQADFLYIEGLVYIAGMGNSFFNEDLAWLDFLEEHQPSGWLEQLDVSLPIDEPEDIKVNTQFNHISFILPESEPSAVHNLHGSIAYHENRTWLTLNSENMRLDFNRLFRNSLDINVLKGTLEILHKDHVWTFSTNSLQIDTPHISIVNRVKFNVPENGRAFLDLTSQFKNANGNYVSLYLPAGILDPGLVAWLDRSIETGRVVKGGYQFYGYLDDAPFYKKQGVSLVDFNVEGVKLSYLEGWPSINDIKAHLRIENDSILVTGKNATILNSKIRRVRAYIDNLTSPTLDVKGKVNVKLADLRAFVEQSGLHEQVSDYISNVELAGEGELDLELFLPLYGDYHTEWGGKLALKDGTLKLVKENYQFTDLQGDVQFAVDTVESTGLHARIDNKPVNIEIKTTRQKKQLSYDIGLKGNFSVTSLMSPAPAVQSFLSGDAEWDILLNINPSDRRKKTAIKIDVMSDLQGVSSTLPGKLGKSPTQALPLKMAINIQPGSASRYDLSLNEEMHINAIEENAQWLISVDDESVKGEIAYNPSAGIEVPLGIDLEYLDLNKFLLREKSVIEQESENENVTDGVPILSRIAQKKKALADALSATETSKISPREIPSLELSAKKLRWKKFVFSSALLKTRQTKLGMTVENLDLVSSDYSIFATGNWLSGWNNKNTTRLDADIVIGDLGNVLKQLEISDDLLRAPGSMQLKWQWQGAPYELNWGKLNGSGHLRLKEGTIKNLNAGIGRLLGLLNFETLLTMDFGSQVSRGFSFDSVKSTFSFEKGNLYTSDFMIESKAADISMSGHVDIENELIDQRVTVQPNLDSTLSLGTAVVAGPTVGALLYVFQKAFNTSSLSSYQYSLKGKIDDPKVEMLSVPRGEEEDDEFDF